MDKNYLVTKSNYLIMNSSYDLSLEEQKLILTLASMVQPEDEGFKSYKFKIADFIKLLGIENKSKYTETPKITKELMKKVFEIEEDDTIIQIAWLSSATYKKGTGMVELEFSPRLKPYMLKLNSMFTQYKLSNILSLKSKYSPRIYEILKANEFKKQGSVEIEVEDLRKLLKADNIYPRYYDFRIKVIEQVQKELKKLTDIDFQFEELKTGRKVTSIKFYIHKNKSTKIKEQPLIVQTADDVAATVSEPEEDSSIEKVMAIMKGHDITALEAKKIYDSSQGNIELIYKVYEDKKNTQITGGIVGLMISLVKPGAYIEPKKSCSKGSFNDYEQRKYDFDALEKKLLGWDNSEDDNGVKFDQIKIEV